ncbi:hypothetical protein B0T18DRAFT_443328 [Schizothecium vesticola]|uniref:Uncharacterized protein n=1 Tax=Schizothecium vesticola TaxID=314040 RepID=A0AA40FC88_9PEZI|nr:hypothetical protein B0T18DRAFT_443328 [Schizothecium vesticola]
MESYPTPAPPGLAPDVPTLPDTYEWNRTVDKFIALEVDATRNEVAQAVWHVMTSMPWSLSSNAMLSSEVRCVLAACSKKQYELDKVRADLARQQNELDNRKLEVKAKQNKLDKQQKQIHKFEKWFLQVDLIERIERIGKEAKLGPESETDSEVDTEAGWNDPVLSPRWDCHTSNPSSWNEPAASFQQNEGNLEHSTHGPVSPARYSADSWGIDNDQSANTNEIKNKSPNNPEPIKTESPTKAESPGKDTPAYKSTYDGGHPSWMHFDAIARAVTKSVNNGDKSGEHSGVAEATWADPTVASRIPWANPTAAPKIQQENHNIGCTCYLGDFGQPCSAKAHTRESLWHKALKSAKPAHKQHSVWDSNNKPTNVDKGDKGDRHNSVGESAYHWHDNVPDPGEWVSTFVGTKVSDGQYKFDGSCALRPRYSDRPRRPSSGLRYLDELTNQSVNNGADSEKPDNDGESTNVADWTVPCTWTDDELTDDKSNNDKLNNDKLTDDKLTDIDAGESTDKVYGTWSFSDHSSDADNLTTSDLPVVTPDSSEPGSRTRSHVSKGPYKRVKVKASAPEEKYEDWHKYEDPRYKGWTFAEIDDYDAAGQAW